MSKIVQAINSMIQNKELITDIKECEKKYLFKYKQYVWSIEDTKNGLVLIYYPILRDVYEVIDFIAHGSLDGRFIQYRNDDIKTREADESFKDLYLIIKEKLYNADRVLDDIIGDL